MKEVVILKGVNKGFRFKGLVGKYVIAAVAVFFFSFICIMIGSIFFKNMFLVVLFFLVIDVFLIYKIFQFNKKYGENGLEVYLSAKFKPKLIRINDRRYLDIKVDNKTID